MNNQEIQEVLDELHTVRPEMLNKKGKKLFEAIMKIADERDKYKNVIKEVRNKSSDVYDLLCELEEIYDIYQEESKEFDKCLKKIENIETLIDEILTGDYE